MKLGQLCPASWTISRGSHAWQQKMATRAKSKQRSFARTHFCASFIKKEHRNECVLFQSWLVVWQTLNH